MKRLLGVLAALLLIPCLASAQNSSAKAVSSCGSESFTAGHFYSLEMTTTGNLCTNASGGGGGGGTSMTDEGTFTPGTTAITPVGGTYNTGSISLSSGQGGALRLTTDRAVWMNLQEQAGTTLGTPTNYGTAPSGSSPALSANAFVTNANANGQAVAANSSPVVQPDPCANGATSQFTFASSSGTIQLVAGSSGKKVYMCSLEGIGAAAWVGNLIEGTGSACATANEAAVWGSTTAASGESFAANSGWRILATGVKQAQTATAANGICILQSGTVALAGGGTYVQQ